MDDAPVHHHKVDLLGCESQIQNEITDCDPFGEVDAEWLAGTKPRSRGDQGAVKPHLDVQEPFPLGRKYHL